MCIRAVSDGHGNTPHYYPTCILTLLFLMPGVQADAVAVAGTILVGTYTEVDPLAVKTQHMP